jgi:hypothetical protein
MSKFLFLVLKLKTNPSIFPLRKLVTIQEQELLKSKQPQMQFPISKTSTSVMFSIELTLDSHLMSSQPDLSRMKIMSLFILHHSVKMALSFLL